MFRVSILPFCLFLAFIMASKAHAVEEFYVLGNLPESDIAIWNSYDLQPQTHHCAFVTAQCLQPLTAQLSSEDRRWLMVKPEDTALFTTLLLEGISSDQVSGIILWGVGQRGWQLPESLSSAPPLLVLLSNQQTPEKIRQAREFVDGYRELGGTANLFIFPLEAMQEPGKNLAAALTAADFMGRDIDEASLEKLIWLTEYWDNPPIDHNEFYDHPELLSERRLTNFEMQALEEHYRVEPHLVHQWDTRDVTLFDLIGYRDKVAPGMRYATLTNLRGEQIYLDLDAYAPYRPSIVVGIGDMTNLYRTTMFYQALAQYSWTDDPAPYSVRVLGPFLTCELLLPPELRHSLRTSSALELSGIEFSDGDPMQRLSEVPEHLRGILTRDNGCIHCHATNVTSSTAHHLSVESASPQGGFALPLAEYPDNVIRTFIYDQVKSANAIGMTPNFVDPALADDFYEWIVSLRVE